MSKLTYNDVFKQKLKSHYTNFGERRMKIYVLKFRNIIYLVGINKGDNPM